MSRPHDALAQVSEHVPSRDERNWAVLCHLSAAVGFLFPFGNVVGPLLVWLWKRDGSPYIDYHGSEAVNFQISTSVYLLAGFIVSSYLIFDRVGSITEIPMDMSSILMLPIFGALPVFLVRFVQCLGAVVAAVRASKVEPYRYPFTIRLIS